MKSLLDKLMAQQCPKHASPYGFIDIVETNEIRMLCDKCIAPSNATKIISIRKIVNHLEEKYNQENQNRLQITSLWQQFKHNSEQIRRTLKDLEEVMELLFNSINEDQVTRILNDDFLNGLSTQPVVESVGQYLRGLIDQDSQRQFTLKQQQFGQYQQQCILQCNNILEGQNKANAELSQLHQLIQYSIEYYKNINLKDGNSLDISNYIYETKQIIKLKDKCQWISLSSNETQMVAAVGKQINLYQLSAQGQWIENQVPLIGHTENIWKVKFNHNSTLIASCGSDNQIIIWSKHLNGQWSILDKLNGPHMSVWSICFNHNSSLLASGSDEGTIQIHNINNGKWELQQSLTEQNQGILFLSFNNESTKLASGSSDHSIIIWELDNQLNWVIFQTLKGHKESVMCIQFNSESNQLISSSSDKTFKIWVIDNHGKWILSHSIAGHSDIVRSVNFNKQSNLIVSSSNDKSIKIWKINLEGIWKCTQTIDQHENQVRNVIINSDSSMIISCSFDKTIKIHQSK